MEFNLHNIINLELAKEVEKSIHKVFSHAEVDLTAIYKMLSPPPKSDMGELAFPCFSLSKALKKAPNIISQELSEEINSRASQMGLFKNCKSFGPYINFFLNEKTVNKLVIESVISEDLFKQNLSLNAPKTIVEYSQPNTHKVMHVGHMRNLCLGNAIVNLYKYAGVETLSTTFPGDVGTHVAKCLWYMKKHSNEEVPLTRKGEWLGGHYVRGNSLLEEQKGTPQEEINRSELTQILKELHAGSGEYYELWKQTRQWSLELMQEVYDWAEVHFDSWYWESDVDADSVALVQEYLSKGLFIKDNGAVGIDLKEDKLGFCLLLKSDGTGLYATKDLELARRKFIDQKVEQSLYVVDNRQSLHFKQVFKTLEKMGFENAKNCLHLQYEMVELKDGAMSSRKGNIVPIQTLIEEMNSMIKDSYLNKYQGEWSTEEIERTAHIVASGAIKYGMTRVDSNKKIIFEINDWLKLDGESGPYIQYVHARIKSMLTKVGEGIPPDYSVLDHPLEKEMINKISLFNQTVEHCVDHNKTHPLCSYLYDLSKSYNSFYAECSVLKAENDNLKYARADLSKSVALCLKHGLKLLGITAPEKM